MSAVLFEPAEAYAAARCLAARTYDERLTSRHPRRCGWCDYPTETLSTMVTGFNQWADFSERHGTSGRGDVRAFQALPGERQEALIVEAQAFEDAEPVSSEGEGGSDPQDRGAGKDRLAAVFDVSQVQSLSVSSKGTDPAQPVNTAPEAPADAPPAWTEELP